MFSTTLCYIEHKDHYLMLHRVKKEHDHAMDDLRYFVSTVLSAPDDGFFALAASRS